MKVYVNKEEGKIKTMQQYREQNADQLQRKERIEGACSTLSEEQLSIPHHHHILINHHYKLLYCWIHKAASTSWIAIFSFLANRMPVHKYYREIKVLAVKSDEELRNVSKNRDYTKFLLVRNPFERLVSAYRDRIEDNSRFTAQAWLYAPKMLSQRQLARNKIFKQINGNKLVIVPTFQEFVMWLISIPPDHYDVHWRRYHDHCMPCGIHYDVILKFETFNHTDQQFLMEVAGLKDVGIHLRHLQQSAGGVTTSQVSCQYFKNLTSQQVWALYAIYELDFKMFGYSPDMYLNCAQNLSQIPE